MSTPHPAIATLRAAIQHAERRCEQLTPLPPQASLAQLQAHVDQMADHRIAVLGELMDAFDRIEPGLGERLRHACCPYTSDDSDEAIPGGH